MLDAQHHRLRPSLVFGPRLGVGWGFAQVLSPLLGDPLIFRSLACRLALDSSYQFV